MQRNGRHFAMYCLIAPDLIFKLCVGVVPETETSDIYEYVEIRMYR